MRTTVTLEPDIAAKLRAVARERGQPFKVALNEALRAGLRGTDAQARAYRFPSRALGLKGGVDLDRALRLAGELEDAEIVRRLELRK
ncbi:MAG: hypothetical protein ACYCYA_13195 [Actinomycetes bacterium]